MNKIKKIIHPKIKGGFMFRKNKLLDKSINKLTNILEEMNVNELIYILGSRKEIILRNLYAGVFRGVGIGIGITIITAILVLVLRKIVTLNIPVIGEYVSDIVDIVEKSR